MFQDFLVFHLQRKTFAKVFITCKCLRPCLCKFSCQYNILELGRILQPNVPLYTVFWQITLERLAWDKHPNLFHCGIRAKVKNC
jgi:hypothetical protein